MKNYAMSIMAAVCLLLVSCSTLPGSSPKPIDLFNGYSLDGWSHVLVDDAVKKEDVWSVQDGIMICKGAPLGYLFTNTSFQNYRLTVEWRWAPGTEPGNSGVLLRIAGEPETFMPKCVEAQLQSGSAGDIWAFYGARVEGDGDRIREIKGHKALGDFMGFGKIKAAENSPGQWNQYEIILNDGDLELRVNGELVNQATGLDALSGPIGLQSEGGEIHFRNVRLSAL